MSSGRSGQSGHQQPQWRERPDGFWEVVTGDGTLFYQQSDGHMRQVPRIRDMTGSLGSNERHLLQQYLMTTEFTNHRGETVEVTVVNVVTGLHKSSSNVDPNGNAGPHLGVQLTNDALWNDDATTYMLHFRPSAVKYSFFYNQSQSRKLVTKGQSNRYGARYDKKDDKDKDKDKRGRPGGGAGTAGSSSGKGRSAGSQQYSGSGGDALNSDQYYQNVGYGYSHGGHTYSVEGFPQLFGFLLLQVWCGMTIGYLGVAIDNTFALPHTMSFRYGMSLHVTVYIAPENVGRFFAAFGPVYSKVIAEPECLFFTVYQTPEEPGKISWVEDWSKSPDWFLKEQITKDYYKEYMATTEPMFIKPREFQFLERFSPQYCYSVVSGYFTRPHRAASNTARIRMTTVPVLRIDVSSSSVIPICFGLGIQAQWPNIVFIITDDQDLHLGSLDYQPVVKREMVEKGTTFSQHYYVTVAKCCPSRTSLLRGQAGHSTNITEVSAPGGNYDKWLISGQNEDYLPHWLTAAGYKTGYIGKIMNGYNMANYDQGPGSWTHIQTTVDDYTYEYNNVVMSLNGQTPISYPGYHQSDAIRAMSVD
ncbi:hypothetical protein CHU98_g3596 [Xylaria longipes]|nr:hypothetical protein CHU98_g3596 [Xylaria longipes]